MGMNSQSQVLQLCRYSAGNCEGDGNEELSAEAVLQLCPEQWEGTEGSSHSDVKSLKLTKAIEISP